jgi:regulator of sigma E protease
VQPARTADGPKIGVRDVGAQRVFIKLGPLAALGAALEETGRMVGMVTDILRRLVTGRTSVKVIGGPIAIAQQSGVAASLGVAAFFGFIAFISVNVGLLNLMPIVPLDGGHLLILLVEGVARRDVNATVKGWIMNAGAVAILLLVAAVIYSDLSKTAWFSKILP